MLENTKLRELYVRLPFTYTLDERRGWSITFHAVVALTGENPSIEVRNCQLPTELTTLCFARSLFHLRAAVWQFRILRSQTLHRLHSFTVLGRRCATVEL
jgi:hypothetical protein